MRKFGKSQPVRRVEDQRFLTGTGRYIDEDAPRGALRAVFLRSTVAHGEISALDVSEARAAPGVHLVLTIDDLVAAGLDVEMTASLVKLADGSRGAAPARPVLARGKVRFVGEAVALVVAESLDAARDAAELIELEIETLPAHLGLAAGGEPIHPDLPDNIAFDWETGEADAVDAAISGAAHVVTMEIDDSRLVAASMEPRGAWAEVMDDGRLHLAFSGQGVWEPKRQVARALGLAPDDLRVTIPDVGGGFGMKAQMYPEYIVIAEAARRLGRAVHWMEDRSEAMLADNAGRDLTHRATMAFDADLRITGYRVETVANLGAYNSQFGQMIQTSLFARVLTGVYDIPAAHLAVRGVFTNTTQVDAYRGAGRPEAIYALERLMDHAARELAVDPWDLRARNFIPPAAFPYTTRTGETYDVGDFPRLLARVEEVADRAGFAARRDESAARGKLRGLGLCYYIEAILGDPSEDVTVEFTDDARVRLYVGTQSNGQGHETVFARFLADQTGIPMDRIEVVQGDSDRIARGGGTGGSRSVTVQTHVTLKAVETMVQGFADFLAGELGVAPGDVNFDDEVFRVPGSNLAPTMMDVAALAHAAGRSDLLKVSETARLPARSFPNGAHVAEVEVDPETGAARVDRYSVTDDFGNLINPLLVEGQVHGGVVQGLGQVMMERVVFDDDGQPLSASLMDYALPRAGDVPEISFTTEPVPSTANPMGMKGCGEAGTVGAMAAVGNAMADALWQAGVRAAQMPFTPERVWRMLEDAKGR
ncbi:xanthine dehydrogenase family protein molybdopterin-binding subunit [Sinisalibacter lacisalsi]|uniref:Carbon monoxide dehydrogenase n=1 Tax=Sinisalibacter lacisalsi TaxID=1526570 RepID=A0ABQ1QS52_9RHOB|nr:xanthine dehydrogenase family protein molybdopterin-binding subunit [Sinisalibacter lacisalsi]GGD39722.1 carbon monoxide dehydrogenase [Sinisalibacter lacisalsi]